jgi:predicted PurR-regulated permease PerM
MMPRSTATLVHLATLVLVVVALYFGKPVLMPVALATLFTFLLSPVVSALCRTGLRQSFSVLVVVVLGFSILGAMLWGFGTQMTALVADLPDYKQNIREKVVDLRKAGSGSSLEKIRQTWRELRGEIRELERAQTNPAPSVENEAAATNATPRESAPEREPVPVVVRGQSNQTLWTIPTALGPLAEVAATAALVVILVIFMLLRGRELRDRIIILFGQNRIPTTTRALDEAAERISRYLLMQTIVNGAYGFTVGTALYFLGLPYALMWGFMAALLRFIPYVGPWFGAAMPILLSLAVFPGWLHPLLVLGIILVLELFSNMLMEPMLYGPSVGISEVALIVAIAFWTWIWGSIGLVLATPLTVCLIVLGKHVPSLAFLPLLMGDEPVMTPRMRFYQRLLAMDEGEANEIAKKFQAKHELIEFHDDLLLPALLSAKRDYKSQDLSDEHLDFIVETAEKLINKAAASAPAPEQSPAVILGIPVEDSIDELILRMLGQVLPASVQLRAVSCQRLPGELMDEIEQDPPAVVCIGTTVSGGTGEMRYLAKRLRLKFPAVTVILGRWGLAQSKRKQELEATTGVSEVATNLTEARNFLVQFAQLKPMPLEKTLLAPLLQN